MTTDLGVMKFLKPQVNIVEYFDNTLYMYDSFTQQELDSQLDNLQPKYIVNDSWTRAELETNIPIFFTPIWLADHVELFKPFDPLPVSNQYTFNFMINKKMANRHLCLKLVELFNLTDYAYTWSGISPEFDLSVIISELNQLGNCDPLSEKQRTLLLSPVKIKPNFIEYPGNVFNHTQVKNYGGNPWVWKNGAGTMFSSSAISLITETVEYTKGATFTEKTLFSVLGLSLPIWVGGYRQASEWSRLGFDNFSDVIDHSYENYDTLFERCYHAIADNLDLLSDKQRSSKLRQQLLPRLEKNRNLILNQHLIKVVKNDIATWPVDLQQQVPTILKNFPRVKVGLNL